MLCVRQVDLAEDRMKINVQVTRKNLTLIGMLDGPRDRFELMLALYEKHKIKPVIDRVFKFDEAKEALQYLWSRRQFGKIVLRVSPRLRQYR
jgi:NADPH:quinone reductase-like Zn-dependent oxidoreductase